MSKKVNVASSPVFKQLLSNIAKLYLSIIESDKKVSTIDDD
jgi:hypothetical protein